MKYLTKVFIVSDDSVALECLEAILGSQDYDVKCFKTAEEFLAVHHPTQVGCVLIDLWVPGMGASELVQRLQESGSLLSIIVVSGMVEPVAQSKDAKLSARLLKRPDEISSLLESVQEGIARSVRRRGNRPAGN